MSKAKIPFVLLPTFLLLLPGFTYAASKHVHKSYQQRLNKSRAERGYTNNGTVIYNYQEIDAYSDELEDEEIGHLKTERIGHVREIHNTVIIHGNVDSEKEELAIGKVDLEKPGSGGTIENDVTITGDVKAQGETLEIGTVRIGGGQYEHVDNSVEIQGDIHAE